MVDGGLVYYDDDKESYSGCPTCNYGSEYINDINIKLTKHKIHIVLNQMYDYVVSEGDMMEIFLTNNNDIQAMTEEQFIAWLKIKVEEIMGYTFDEATDCKYEVTNK
jgi:desulfoferrodoxin (superoxide reductase-like protein)